MKFPTTMIGLITDIIKYIPIEYEYLYHTSSDTGIQWNNPAPQS